VPTAYCGKFGVYESVNKLDYSISSEDGNKMELCNYDPPAGTKTQHTAYDITVIQKAGDCPGGYTRYGCRYDFGYWRCFSDSTCNKREICEDETCTCEGTKAYIDSNCYTSSYKGCTAGCPDYHIDPNGAHNCRNNCIKSAFYGCGEAMGSISESYLCQPNTCSSETGEIGQCYFEENHLGKIYRTRDC